MKHWIIVLLGALICANVLEGREEPAHASYRLAIEATIEKLEQEVGMDFAGKVPRFRFGKADGVAIRSHISYEIDTNTIVVPPYYQGVEPSTSFEVQAFLGFSLAHFYLDILTEESGPYRDTWFGKVYRDPDVNWLSIDQLPLLMVRSGIAEYCGNAVLPAEKRERDYFPDSSWESPKYDRDDFLERAVMEYYAKKGGQHLVAPILRKNGDQGIRYLLMTELKFNIPDFKPVLEYRKNAQRHLTMK